MVKAMKRLLICSLAFCVSAAIASTEPPEALVKRSVEEILAAIGRTPDREALRKLAEQKVLPNFDFREMTRLAVGANWRKASPEQQTALVNGFRTLLVNLYTSALSQSGERNRERSVVVRPPAPGSRPEETTVKTVVKEAGGLAVEIDYRMLKRDDGWKVYDVLVEGISLVTSYRTSFDNEVAKSGVDGLIRVLEQKNRGGLKS